MSEFTYKALVGQPKVFLAMTGLKPDEFKALLPCFQSAYEAGKAAAGKLADEQRGRAGKLATLEGQLFFILFYLKTYPLQEVLA